MYVPTLLLKRRIKHVICQRAEEEVKRTYLCATKMNNGSSNFSEPANRRDDVRCRRRRGRGRGRTWLAQVSRAHWRSALFVLAPLAVLPLPLVSGLNRDWCAFMMIIMAVYWVFEVLPLAATAVIPVVLCPMLGILGTNEVSMQYMKGSNMLFVGGKQKKRKKAMPRKSQVLLHVQYVYSTYLRTIYRHWQMEKSHFLVFKNTITAPTFSWSA